VLGGPGWSADAMAVSPDGSRVAISFGYLGTAASCGVPGAPKCAPQQSDYVDVVSTATGAVSVWHAGATAPGQWFSVGDLSWTSNGRELVYLGQWCSGPDILALCPSPDTRTAEVMDVDPAAGGDLASGNVLLRQSAGFPYIDQAVVSPDGSALTAIVLHGPVMSTSQEGGFFPRYLSVVRISVATGSRLAELYHTDLGVTTSANTEPSPLALIPDGSGQNWILDIGVCGSPCGSSPNGWIHDGSVVPLRPSGVSLAGESWQQPGGWAWPAVVTAP
jgi:hypothetical protein